MNLFRWKGGGGALMHVYVWEHIASQNRLMDVYETW